ncbi:hypothetical protein BHM03_00037125 [Ensete ventricosum]|uniref:Uncharacterized protein n=1 Tax=Ensete ventricosum TaxID=4639 RepID=A0A445MJP4_ENSVE|nr:hypothetical protein BHM03_00037125 [Ensete ventricosum]
MHRPVGGHPCGRRHCPRVAPRKRAGVVSASGASMGAPLRAVRGRCSCGLAADKRHPLWAGYDRAGPLVAWSLASATPIAWSRAIAPLGALATADHPCRGSGVAAAGGLQVQTVSQTIGATHDERDSKQDEREIGYSPQVEEAPSGAPTRKKSHNERLTMVKTSLDVLEASLEELYQSQRRLLGVESSLEEAESRIEKVESLIDQLT